MTFRDHRITAGIGADDPYWEYLEAGEFRLPRCAGCRAWMWPAHWRCGDCGSWDLEWVAVPPTGTVYSWTRTWYAFDRTKERAADVPYVVLLVEVADAGGARVMGVLAGEDDGVKIGAAVTGTIDSPSPKSKGYPALRWCLQ